MVREGYKRTEVGVIPKDWDVYYLYEIATKITDGEHLTPKRTTAGYYLLSARNIHNGRIDLNDVDFVGTDEYQRIRKRCNPEKGDIVISCSGTIGRVAVIPSEIECVMVRSAALIKPNKDKTDSYFVQYILQSLIGQVQIAQSLNQGAQANLFINHIEKLKTPFPTLPEQRLIAQAISDTDALVAALDKLIAKKRHIKTGTMQQLLAGKKRLPGFGEGKGYKKTEVGMIPEDWDVRGLETLGSNTIPSIKAGPFGSSLTKNTYVPIGYKIYGQEQVIRGDYLYGDYFISFAKFKELESCAVKPGDILLSLVGTAGKVLVIPHNAPLGIINPRLIRLSFDKQLVNAHFFKALFESGEIQSFLSRYAQGGTMGVLNAGMLRSVSIALPSISEQQAIAQVLSDMDTEITALETRRAKTQAIKQGMMQELLTGKTRLI